jgi:hypothetical protein
VRPLFSFREEEDEPDWHCSCSIFARMTPVSWIGTFRLFRHLVGVLWQRRRASRDLSACRCERELRQIERLVTCETYFFQHQSNRLRAGDRLTVAVVVAPVNISEDTGVAKQSPTIDEVRLTCTGSHIPQPKPSPSVNSAGLHGSAPVQRYIMLQLLSMLDRASIRSGYLICRSYVQQSYASGTKCL